MKDILKKNSKLLSIVIISLLLCNFFNTIAPFVVKKLLDIDLMANDTKVLTNLFFLYMAIQIILMLSKNGRNYIINKTMAKLLKDLRQKLFCHVINWNMSTYEKYNSSEIYTRLTVDIDNVSSLFFSTLQIFLNEVLYIMMMVVFMFVVDVKLAIIGSSVILLSAITSYIFTHQVAKANKIILNKRDEANRQYSEMHRSHKLTYLFGLQKRNQKAIEKTLEEEMRYRRKYIFSESFTYPVAITIQAIGIYFILNYAFHINMQVSIGSIYLIINYIQQCREPLNQIFAQMEQIQSSLMSLKRINKLLKEKGKEDLTQGEAVENIKGDIEFVNVSMQYGENKVLKEVSFLIKEGNKVTIAGRTGVGKTTIANILMRLYPVSNGKILIGGKNIKEMRIQDIRKNISYISQTPYILKDTLKNNIILGDTSITDEEIEKAIKEIGFEKVIDKFKDRLEEKIEKSKLSYGQCK